MRRSQLNEERAGYRADRRRSARSRAPAQRRPAVQQLQRRQERLESGSGEGWTPDEAQLEELRMQTAEHEEILSEAQRVSPMRRNHAAASGR